MFKFLGLSILAGLATASPMRAQVPQPRAWGFCENPGRHIALCIDAHAVMADDDPERIRVDGGLGFLDFLTALNETTDITKADKVTVLAIRDRSDVFVGDPNADDSARNLVSNIGAYGLGEPRYALQAGATELEKMGNDPDRRGLVLLTNGLAENQGWVAVEVNNLKNKGIRVSYGQIAVRGGRMVRGIDTAVANAVKDAGGIAMQINNRDDMAKFVRDVTTNGLTHNDNKCKRTDIPPSGGPLGNDHENRGQCIADNEAVYTYTPASQDRNLVENLEYSIELISTDRPTVIVATFINKVTGQTSSVTISKRNPFGKLKGQVRPPEEIEVRVKVTGADQNDCEYKINSNIKPVNPPEPTTSSHIPPDPTTSSQAPPDPTTSQSPPDPTTSPEPSPSTSSSVEPSPSASSSECPAGATSTIVETSTVVSTVVQTETATATATQTVTETQTGNPTPTGDNCICKCQCDQKGAQPMPRFEL